jgi:ProP effector
VTTKGWYAKASAGIARLAELFPRTFFVYEGKRRPLKIGISNEIITTGAMEPSELHLALRLYCTSFGYRSGMRAGANRIDLNGEPAGEVTAADAATAEELQQRRKQFRARKEARQRESTAETHNAAEKTAPVQPKHFSLIDLKQAAMARRKMEDANA